MSNKGITIDTESLDTLARAQLPKVLEYCKLNGITSITKSSPIWMGIDARGNAVVIPHEVYKPAFPAG